MSLGDLSATITIDKNNLKKAIEEEARNLYTTSVRDVFVYIGACMVEKGEHEATAEIISAGLLSMAIKENIDVEEALREGMKEYAEYKSAREVKK